MLMNIVIKKSYLYITQGRICPSQEQNCPWEGKSCTFKNKDSTFLFVYYWAGLGFFIHKVKFLFIDFDILLLQKSNVQKDVVWQNDCVYSCIFLTNSWS